MEIARNNDEIGKCDKARRYAEAREVYRSFGVDTEVALEKLSKVEVSMHCWQGDDVVGFDSKEALSGGIQTTGNYPYRARNPKELMEDIKKVISLVPGAKKLNLHASYAIIEEGETINGRKVDRDNILPKHFKKWVDFAKENDLGIDFNPTFFSHPMVKDGLTLSSPDEEVRRFWVEHGKRCLEISEYFANETGKPCLMNIWIPDGYKDIPADRLGPRARFKQSLDEILSIPYDKTKVFVCLESKVFGIGVESYTVGSAEFCMNYVANAGITPLMDNGHYHPTELVSDKISSMLLFNKRLALHITRPVRWDSDHVILFDDETREICKEIVRADALDRVFIATDYFDASINRISAWTTGLRNLEKALLYALLEPSSLKELQNKSDFTKLMVMQEKLKELPFGDIWQEYLRREGVVDDYYSEVARYEKEVLSKRVDSFENVSANETKENGRDKSGMVAADETFISAYDIE
ncbi:L-rhamnose isomerase [Lachnospira pectinoschiza]|uniref:L-rhamnose isomerase n=1 Tax=Lachnospira pectinoschiza TaxID=28052 RepID=A0A1G9VWJ0_9FIRM|nr:L-rhamnose isomerase [Lachnospira pectinoschiza]SDM76225.1 L-rhamnose isomerase [Lachnospira pectinoschiza]